MSHTRKPMTFLIFSRVDIYVGVQVSNSRPPTRLSIEEQSDIDSLYASSSRGSYE